MVDRNSQSEPAENPRDQSRDLAEEDEIPDVGFPGDARTRNDRAQEVSTGVEQSNDEGEESDEETDEESDDETDEETSLDALAAAYAGLVGSDKTAPPSASSPSNEVNPEVAEPLPDGDVAPPATGGGDVEKLDEQVSPLGILEAVLFVGNSENSPLTAKRIAALMRGVSPREVDELVVELNERYLELEAPYEIISQGAGYLLNIRDEYAGLRDRFYGSVREARLSQAAIDILAVIAYGQPLTREEIDETRGKPSGGILSQLVRRQLLRIERPDKKPRNPKYYTTDRFLKIMGLEDIAELPESQEFDKNF